MKTAATTIPLADIEPDEPINARRTRSDEGIEELKASIRAHGLIQALRVRHRGGAKVSIIAGHRRHRVLCELATTGDTAGGIPVTPDFEVPVIFGDVDDDTARELSQAENFIRLPQHEADTYETFRELADRGLDKGQIAARFGIDPKRVDRMLALGRLSPVILEAWRVGEFDRYHGRDSIRAFTLAPSTEEQERVFAKLKKEGTLWAHTIKYAFGAGNRDAAKALKFVGADDYRAAGGNIIEDLFGDESVISDAALVLKLAAAKLQAEVDRISKEGWSWTALASDLPGGWNWNWQKMSVSKRPTKVQKAQSGAVVDIDRDGKLSVTYGVVKPAATKRAVAKGNGPKEKSAPKISDALHQRLSVQATMATRKALTNEPRLGLVVLLAGHLSSRSNSPIKAYHEGMGWRAANAREDFTAAVRRLSAMTDADLFHVAAGIAGQSVDLHTPEAHTQIFGGHRNVLASSIDRHQMTGALRETFDAADYFGSASKPFIIAAIREAINDDEARKAEKMKKAELTAFALANVPQTGWLPPELRAPTYSGPGAIPVLAEAPPIEPDEEDLVDEDLDEDEAA